MKNHKKRDLEKIEKTDRQRRIKRQEKKRYKIQIKRD